ncbi:hypothetical protein ACFV1N_30770 [Streptosporangium canum]|uniref:hypothetical protein n=1 Tax=Streptosporangium canum TaxID=324952 RepID=UPI003684FB74
MSSSWQDLTIDTKPKTPETRLDSSGSADTALALVDDARVVECWKHEQEAGSLASNGYLVSRSDRCGIQPVASGDAEFGKKNMINGITANATITGNTYGNGSKKPTNLRCSHYRISLKNVIPFEGAHSKWASMAFNSWPLAGQW